ncbi:restriction endonuclease subunit S [Desulfatibacillum aliphaticivorans]|uniref:restriction endonuclease subunit S n=1 Tax=Desulfatibacillum aliphaticivorans TaxID=218208 RepID=UPI0004126985|nr:restriction endonuclease subunit S [Desulfatibacillum aliphaticivorans]
MNNKTVQLLEQRFDVAFAAPEGVKKLREVILTLAMQGRLVEQDPNDPPASELLKKIQAEKQRLVKAKKIKKPKPLPPVKPEDMPYELPQGWEWVRLGEIGIINPRNDAEDLTLAGFVPMPLIPEGYSETHQFEERQWGDIKKGYTHFANGDVGMAKITPCFENAKSCVFSDLPNGIGAGTTELHIFRNTFKAVIARFLLYYLKNPLNISKAVPNMTGSAGQKRVPTPYFTAQPFPLPPIAEQQRIVAKIDLLMARCDELEKLKKERAEKRLAVHASAIKKLLEEPGAPAWDFLQRHFGELYAVKENVTELREAILQLAVMGRLVPQDPNDPPASELLKEIKAEKQRLVRAGEIKTPKPLPPIAPEEAPYRLPQGWAWTRLGELGHVMGGGTPRKTNPIYWDGTIPWVSPKDMKVDYMIDTQDHVSPKGIKNSTLKLIPINAILMVVRGMILAHSFPTSLTEATVTINQDMKALCPYVQGSQQYLLFYLKGMKNIFLNLVERSTHGTCRLDSKKLFSTIVSLPPLPEQHRIVARINRLMSLCDTLDQQIAAAEDKQTELLNAVMAKI